jgi:hypothetical protein
MTDACIVCLEDLETIPHDGHEEKVAGAVPITTITTNPGKHCDDDLIAQIKPCGHVLHDHCLREWSQKANSCPICRSSFNLVEVLDRVGGMYLSFAPPNLYSCRLLLFCLGLVPLYYFVFILWAGLYFKCLFISFGIYFVFLSACLKLEAYQFCATAMNAH